MIFEKRSQGRRERGRASLDVCHRESRQSPQQQRLRTAKCQGPISRSHSYMKVTTMMTTIARNVDSERVNDTDTGESSLDNRSPVVVAVCTGIGNTSTDSSNNTSTSTSTSTTGTDRSRNETSQHAVVFLSEDKKDAYDAKIANSHYTACRYQAPINDDDDHPAGDCVKSIRQGGDDDNHIPVLRTATVPDDDDDDDDIDDGNCLPTVQEIHQSQYHRRHSHGRFGRKKPKCALVVAILLFLLCLVMAILYRTNTSSTNHGLLEGVPSFTLRYNRTMEYLVRNNISNPATFIIYGTPQYFATSYMADTLQLPIPTTFSPQDSEVYRYIARYVLALDYFHFTNYNQTFAAVDVLSQSGKNHPEQPQFMNFVTSGEDICQWNRRTGSTSHNDSKNMDPNQNNGTIQMGVTCDDKTKLPINLTINNMKSYSAFPTENGLLTSLQILNIENNNGVGTIPTELCQLTNLRYLNVGRNSFYSHVPACFGDKLTNLQSLYLHGNNLHDPLPLSMTNLKELKHFILSDNVLSGDPIPIWNQLTSLEVLLADRNKFLSSIDIKFLWNSTQLRILDVSENDMELAHNHPFPRHLLQMSSLQILDFSRNRLEGTLHSGLQSNNVLQYLSLYDNMMFGTIHELTNLRNLEHLDVSENEFTGTIPTNFGSLTDARSLFLGDNDYNAGQIPASFANLTQLEVLSIRNSQLNGTIDLSSIPTSLVYLDLGGNMLSGPIPATIGNVKNLEYFIINDNLGINGSVTTAITQLTSLRAIFLDGTSVKSGVDYICSLPKFLDNSTGQQHDAVAFADCGSMNGPNGTELEVECKCCHCCIDSEIDGKGCSKSYQQNLRQDWSEDFQTLKFSASNQTDVFSVDNTS